MAADQWLCLSISVPTAALEVVSDFLIALGSSGTAEEEWKPDTPRPAHALIQGFFSIDQDAETLQDKLRSYLQTLDAAYPGIVESLPSCEIITSAAWQDQWKEHFPPPSYRTAISDPAPLGTSACAHGAAYYCD